MYMWISHMRRHVSMVSSKFCSNSIFRRRFRIGGLEVRRRARESLSRIRPTDRSKSWIKGQDRLSELALFLSFLFLGLDQQKGQVTPAFVEPPIPPLHRGRLSFSAPYCMPWRQKLIQNHPNIGVHGEQSACHPRTKPVTARNLFPGRIPGPEPHRRLSSLLLLQKVVNERFPFRKEKP